MIGKNNVVDHVIRSELLDAPLAHRSPDDISINGRRIINQEHRGLRKEANNLNIANSADTDQSEDPTSTIIARNENIDSFFQTELTEDTLDTSSQRLNLHQSFKEDVQPILQCNANNTLCCASLDADEDAIDDWWSHHPDWEEHTDKRTMDRELQDPDEVCFRPMQDLQRATFFRKLYAMQFASEMCDNDLQAWQINAGYGASVNQIVRPMWAAYNQGRPFQMTKHWEGARWLYSTNETDRWNYCETTDMNCYFLPLGACKPVYRRNDKYTQSAFNTQDEKRQFQWVRQYVTRPRHRARKQLHAMLKSMFYTSLANNCTIMHVRRGDVGYPRRPFRRYAAVEEYLELLPENYKNTTIVLLTDDETTIEEVNAYHKNDYNWVWMDRPRNNGVKNGMDGHIPSGDEGAEIIAILAEVKLASQCHTIVHGHSGFVATIKDEMDAVGHNYSSFFLDTTIGMEEMKEWRTKHDPKGRVELMLNQIHSRHNKQQASNSVLESFHVEQPSIRKRKADSATEEEELDQARVISTSAAAATTSEEDMEEAIKEAPSGEELSHQETPAGTTTIKPTKLSRKIANPRQRVSNTKSQEQAPHHNSGIRLPRFRQH